MFLYFVAWFPAIAAIMALAANLFSPPIWGLPGSVMLVTLAFAIHVLAVRGLVPRPWRDPK